MKEASVLPPASTLPCKICAGTARKQFGLPHNKKAAHTIPDEPDDCWYYECERCGFLFSPARDEDDQGAIYDETYWTKQDPDWYGRVSQTVRLVALANELLGRKLEDLEILDFGCGMGGFVHQGREHLQLQVWGTDIIKPQVGLEHYLPELGSRQFDVITCCEVVEHFPEPKDTFAFMRKHLKSPGVLAFQTAEWVPELGREWWYLGPHNGHISIQSRGSLDYLFKTMGGKTRRIFKDYPGLQAWRFE